ncbi:hypothetical protein MGYG_04337 [Nannizzia gypsea CBS 118893]|uniref:Uncharacterized protein n=1 Tax=Arthroderma gypseum (strain ATCC MYA-4604 / CBS 118893) TaxID=535722 RepID=E4USC6_ARTGP|nr:hypothetical protein MGYG_04337 [Nannizzia gypsea CBS 118893]EFR01330.1 hypothetical protein MGYG_04337 [Nannizzia gypsea CBS 118893]
MGPPPPASTTSRPRSNLSSIIRSIINIIKALIVKAYTALHASLDAVLPPPKRAEIKSQLASFARERPILASFLASQAIFCGVPLILFVVQIVSVLIFSLSTALVLASLCALTFTAVCTGLALLVLVPVLAVTAFVGVSVWFWGWVCWWALVSFGIVQMEPSSGRVKSEGATPVGNQGQTRVDGFNGVKNQRDGMPIAIPT